MHIAALLLEIRNVYCLRYSGRLTNSPPWVGDDEGVIEFVRPLRVPLPNANPETWTEADCAPAFDALAEQWNEAMISPSAPLFLDVVLTSGEFFRWIDEAGYEHPTFWSPPSDEQGEQTRAAEGGGPRIKISDERPRGKKSLAALEAINELWPDGPPENLQTVRIHRRVDRWIKQQPTTIHHVGEVSREVVARLLGRK
jgi:hypothetical protein